MLTHSKTMRDIEKLLNEKSALEEEILELNDKLKKIADLKDLLQQRLEVNRMDMAEEFEELKKQK